MSENEEEKEEQILESEEDTKENKEETSEIPEEEEVKHISFGITKGNSFNFGTATANAVFRINPREEIITTSREIIRVDSGVIVNRAPHKSCTGVYCPIYDALVTITTVRSVFSVFLLNYDIREPVVTGISLDQIGICHVLFDERNSTIVTFGNGIKTWYLDCLPKESRRTISDNYANIRPRAFFAQFHTSFAMVIPCLDTYNHRIFVPTQDGLLCYDYDGTFLQPPLQHNNHWFTMFAFNPYNKKMLTSDRDEAKESKLARAAQFKKQIVTQGVQYWRKDGSLTKELTFTNASLFAAFFINKEFAVTVDSAFYVHIIDMKTMKFFTCIQIECRPNHIFFQNDNVNINLVICSASNVYYYKICIPWNLWLLTHIPPTMIQRCPRYDCAARIAVQFIDSSVRLFTPYAVLLTLCHSANPASPTSVVIDRGNPEMKDRDQVYVVLENGIVQKFSANECPCLPASTMNLKAHCCCIADIFDKKSILFGSKIGDIMIYDYENWKFIRRIICCEGEILFLFHHEQSKSLFALTDYKMFRVSTETGKVVNNFYQKCHKCAALYDDLLIIGYENGSYLIQRINDEDGSIMTLHKSRHPLHSGRVVGLTKGSNYFVSAGFDGTILVWDMHAIVLVMLSFPAPIYSVGVHNGLRGLLVGTDTEIMFIDGKLLFEDYVDPEDLIYDNYDKKRDYLLGGNKSKIEEEEEEMEKNNIAGGSRRRRRKGKGKKGGDDDSIDLDVGPGHSRGRGRKSQYAAMMERMKEQKEKEEQEKKEKEQQQQEEEEQAAENKTEEEEKQEEENFNENEDENDFSKRRKRKVRRKNDKGEYDEQYEYVDEKGNPIQNEVNVKTVKKKKDDSEEDYTEVKEGLHILAGKEKVIVENLLDPKPVQIDEELKKRIYAEEDEKEEKAKKKKEKKEKEEKEKAEKEKAEKEKGKKKKGDKENPDTESKRGKKGKTKKAGTKKNKNGEGGLENGNENEGEGEDEDEYEDENEDEDENEGEGESKKKNKGEGEGEDDDDDENEDQEGTKKGTNKKRAAKNGENKDEEQEGNQASADKKSPKRPTRPSAQEAQKQNPRNNKIRQNYNDPNANPKFNSKLANQVIDGESLEEAAGDDNEKNEAEQKNENEKQNKGKEKGKSKKGKKNKNAGGREKGFSHGGLDENGNKIADKRYGGPESGGAKGKTGKFGGANNGGQGGAGYKGGQGGPGDSSGYQGDPNSYSNGYQGGPGGYQGGQNGPNGYNGQGGYQGGPGGFQGGPNGYQGGPGGYQGGPNGYQGGPGGYQGGPNGYQGGPGGYNGPGGYQGGPGGFQGGPNGYQGGPNGYNGPGGPNGYQGGPGGYNGPGGYQGGPNGYQGGPNGYQGGPGGYNGPGGYQGGPNGYQGGPGGYQGGPNGYNGPGGYQGGPNGYQGGPGGYNGPGEFQGGQNGYQGGPGGYQGGPNGFQGGPNGYNGQGGPGGFQNGPNGYQNGPNGYNGPGGFQGGTSYDPNNPSSNDYRTNVGTSPIEPHSQGRRRYRSNKGGSNNGEYDNYEDDGSRVTRRRPNSSTSSESPTSLRKRRQRIEEIQRKRSQTPNGTNLYKLHHIIHVHLRVNREFPPDIDIRKAVNPPCLVYSPEYLALALGDDEDDEDAENKTESRWDKFKRMCFFSGVNDFAQESLKRQKHFMLTNSNRIQKVSPVSFNSTLPVAQIYQTDRDPLKNLTQTPRRSPRNYQQNTTTELNSSCLPLLNITNNSINNGGVGNVEYDFDFKADMINQSMRYQSNSARSARESPSFRTMSNSSRRLESRRSLFPFLDDETLRPGSSRKTKTPVRIINPAGKQAYRNLFNIFKNVKKH